MDKYTFVFFNNGWWLKINNIEQLIKYHENIDAKWGKILHNIVVSKEYGIGTEHITTESFAAALLGENRKYNPIESVMFYKYLVLKGQMECLDKFGEIYINQKGGYCFKSPDRHYEQFVHRSKFIFPSFKEKDIRIEQFPMGKHYYVYIGDMQVIENNNVKWNSYSEAMNIAKKYINIE